MKLTPPQWRRLGWEIIRARVLYYYYPDYVQWSDRKYDRLEKVYEKAAKRLGEKPSATRGSEPDRNKPSVALVEETIRDDIKTGLLTKDGKGREP